MKSKSPVYRIDSKLIILSFRVFGGFGVTIIDSLSTLSLMNLTAEIKHAKEFIKGINFKKDVC
jgi:hypothetical protein